MDNVSAFFESHPSQLKVARTIMVRGISVSNGKAMCGDIEQSDSAIARVAGVDRRVVRTTLERISADPEMDALFKRIRPMLNMTDIASYIGCTSFDIIPTDSKVPGILSSITANLFDAGYCIKQMVIGDDDNGRPILSVIVEGSMTPDDIASLKNCTGVDRIVLK